jgi:hypothetical protein
MLLTYSSVIAYYWPSQTENGHASSSKLLNLQHVVTRGAQHFPINQLTLLAYQITAMCCAAR